MPFPADITLPLSAKYFSLKNTTAYNSNYDIVWSISCQVSSVSAQYGICTFLTTLSTPPISALPGQYIGTYIPNNIISIAFDTTGLFALSSGIRPGVSLSGVIPFSLVVRNSSYNVIYNIDYRKLIDREFTNLATIPLSINIPNINNLDNTYTGFSFCSPISTTVDNTATMLVYNFHTDGVINNTLTETITALPLI